MGQIFHKRINVHKFDIRIEANSKVILEQALHGKSQSDFLRKEYHSTIEQEIV